MQHLPVEYRHEPASALQADDEGLAMAVKLLRQAADHLNDHGKFILEVGMSYQTLIERFPEVPFFWFEFKRGGEGVCTLDKKQLQQWFSAGK